MGYRESQNGGVGKGIVFWEGTWLCLSASACLRFLMSALRRDRHGLCRIDERKTSRALSTRVARSLLSSKNTEKTMLF